MRYAEKLENMLCDELDKIAEQGELTAGSLDTVQKLTHSVKSLKTIEAMDDYSEDGYSRGNSYARRDSMGRYSRDDSYGRYNNSYRRGYSRDMDKHQMMEQIEELRRSVEKMD